MRAFGIRVFRIDSGSDERWRRERETIRTPEISGDGQNHDTADDCQLRVSCAFSSSVRASPQRKRDRFVRMDEVVGAREVAAEGSLEAADRSQ